MRKKIHFEIVSRYDKKWNQPQWLFRYQKESCIREK